MAPARKSPNAFPLRRAQVAFGLALLVAWWGLARAGFFPPSLFPGPLAVARALIGEATSLRLPRDILASTFRVGSGFFLATALGVPTGLALGRNAGWRALCLPSINFLRNLSAIAWIPFAILWFGLGDAPVIFLVFLGVFFPLTLAVSAATAEIPAVYLRVGEEFGLSRLEMLFEIALPAVLPQVITALRMTAGLAWTVIVAAEMIAGRDGLGFAIQDSRNGLRADLLIVNMLAIGVIGIALDAGLRRLARAPSLRWGYER